MKTKPKIPKLKPCPVCGGDAECNEKAPGILEAYWVTCKICDITSRAFPSLEKTPDFWNCRAKPMKKGKIK